MKRKQDDKPGARRRFLLGAGAAGAAGAAAVVTTRSGVALPEPTAVPRSDRSGYRVTEHVRSYYRTTLI